MAYPDRLLMEVLGRVDLVELVGRAVSLRRSGRQLKGLCPFHPEKTPSFQVSPDKQVFYCFGCGAGGNAFHFVMKREGLEFREAVRLLAEQAHVELPQEVGGVDRNLIQQLRRLQELAAEFYHIMLTKTDAGRVALEYARRRSLTPETIRQFHIGYAPNQWEGLIQYAKDHGFEAGLLERAGLAVPKRELDGHYDLFRDRLMFPICDERARVVGFGGRVMDESVPKYLNSPETELYQKGRHLYGLHHARPAIQDQDCCVIVEGYLDVAIPYQAGVRNLIATLGTALTEEQVRLIKRYTKRVVILYDADRAGEEATLRSLDIFLEQECQVRVAQLPQGEDPDDIVLRGGAEGLQRYLDQAVDLFHYKLERLERRFGLDSVEGKVQVIDGMLETLKRIRHPITQSERVKHLAELLKIDESAIRAQLKRLRERPRLGAGGVAGIEQARLRLAPQGRTERYLLGLVLDDPKLGQGLLGVIPLEAFQDPTVRSILQRLYAQGDAQATAMAILNDPTQPEAAHLIAEALTEIEGFANREAVFQDCLDWMRRRLVRDHLHTLKAEIAKAQALHDEVILGRLVSEYSELVRSAKGKLTRTIQGVMTSS